MITLLSKSMYCFTVMLLVCFVATQAAESAVKTGNRHAVEGVEGASINGHEHKHYGSEYYGKAEERYHKEQAPEYKEEDYQYMYSREEARDDGPHDYYKEEHYGKYQKKTLCLQEARRTITEDGNSIDLGSVYKSEFRCCENDDDLDFCLEPGYEHKDDYYKNYDKHENQFLDDLVNPAIVATCLWRITYTDCPEYPNTLCSPAVLNCSISHSAKKCGWPQMQFSTNAFYLGSEDASSCLPEYNREAGEGKRRLQSASEAHYVVLEPEHNTNLYTGHGTILKAKVGVVSDYDGYKQVKGELEFGTYFTNQPLKMQDFMFERMLASQKKKSAAPKAPDNTQKQAQLPQKQAQAPQKQPPQKQAHTPPTHAKPPQKPSQAPQKQAQAPQKKQVPAKKHEVDVKPASVNYGPRDSFDPARSLFFVKGGQLTLTLYEEAHY